MSLAACQNRPAIDDGAADSSSDSDDDDDAASYGGSSSDYSGDEATGPSETTSYVHMQSRARRGSTLMTRARSVDTLMTGARGTYPVDGIC